VLLGGGWKAECSSETKAAVAEVGADLRLRSLYADASLGESQVGALSAMSGGRVLIAASKRNIYDVRPAEAPKGGAYGLRELPISMSGMVMTLGQDGRVSAPRMLDSGAYIFVSAAEASDEKDIQIGGSIGEQAAIFHLPAAP
jgi:hypothetical protein